LRLLKKREMTSQSREKHTDCKETKGQRKEPPEARPKKKIGLAEEKRDRERERVVARGEG